MYTMRQMRVKKSGFSLDHTAVISIKVDRKSHNKTSGYTIRTIRVALDDIYDNGDHLCLIMDKALKCGQEYPEKKIVRINKTEIVSIAVIAWMRLGQCRHKKSNIPTVSDKPEIW